MSNPTANLTAAARLPFRTCTRLAPAPDRRGVRAAGVDPGGVPRRLERPDAAVRRLPGGVGLLADHRDGGLRRLRHRRAGRAADRRIAVRHVGRRPVLLVAIAVQAVAMLVFATADGVTSLLVARVVQGLSTGAAVGALGAGLLDLDRAKGTIANGVAPLFGVAAGALVSSLLVQYLPDPTQLVYLVLFAIFVVQAVGVAVMRGDRSREARRARVAAPADRAPRLGAPAAAAGRPRADRRVGAGRLLPLARPGAGPAAGRIALARARRPHGVRVRRQRRRDGAVRPDRRAAQRALPRHRGAGDRRRHHARGHRGHARSPRSSSARSSPASASAAASRACCGRCCRSSPRTSGRACCRPSTSRSTSRWACRP